MGKDKDQKSLSIFEKKDRENKQIAEQGIQTIRKNPRKVIYKPETKGKIYNIKFKHNRSYELPIGRNYIFFSPNELKQVDESVINHKDFTDEVKKYFVITEYIEKPKTERKSIKESKE